MYTFICVYLCMYVCVYIYLFKIQIHNVHICIWIYTYIHRYVPYIGRPMKRSTYIPVITGSANLETQVMEQAAKMSSSCSPTCGGITRVRTSTMASVLSWSTGGWTVWMRMRQVSHLRSVTRQRMSTPRTCLCKWLSTLCHGTLRRIRVIGGHGLLGTHIVREPFLWNNDKFLWRLRWQGFHSKDLFNPSRCLSTHQPPCLQTTLQCPCVISLHSSELRGAGFTLREVLPLELETAARCRSACCTGIRQLEGMGPKRFMLSVDDNTEFRSRCEWMYWCDKCSLITKRSKAPSHCSYLIWVLCYIPYMWLAVFSFAITRVPVYTAISNFWSSCSQRFEVEVVLNSTNYFLST